MDNLEKNYKNTMRALDEILQGSDENKYYYPSYYAIIPPGVRYNHRLSPNAKLLYGELAALQNIVKRVFIGNTHLSKLLGVSTRTIQRLLEELQEHDLIQVEFNYKGRIITVNEVIMNAKKVNKKAKKVRVIKKNAPDWLDEYIANFENEVIDL